MDTTSQEQCATEVYMSDLPHEVQSPTDRVADHVRHEASIESGVRTLMLEDVLDYADGSAELRARRLVD